MSPKSVETESRRRYNSSRRAMQAAQTRADVVHAAIRLFRDSGWAGTTLAAVAREAGVAVETIYAAFGSKKALLRAAYDAAIVGDAEPVPFVERPEFRRLGEGSVDERLQAGMDVLADIHERSAGVWLAVRQAAASDDELDRWRAESEQRRRVDVGRSLERMLGRPATGAMLDVVWVLFGPESYIQLVVDGGHSRQSYQACISEAVRRLTALE